MHRSPEFKLPLSNIAALKPYLYCYCIYKYQPSTSVIAIVPETRRWQYLHSKQSRGALSITDYEIILIM